MFSFFPILSFHWVIISESEAWRGRGPMRVTLAQAMAALLDITFAQVLLGEGAVAWARVAPAGPHPYKRCRARRARSSERRLAWVREKAGKGHPYQI